MDDDTRHLERTRPGEGSVAVFEFPLEFALRQNRPNPFSSRTAIHFDLPAATRVALDIFDIQGRGIRMLASGKYPAGDHAVDGDKRATDGSMVQPGVYLYRMSAVVFRPGRRWYCSHRTDRRES